MWRDGDGAFKLAWRAPMLRAPVPVAVVRDAMAIATALTFAFRRGDACDSSGGFCVRVGGAGDADDVRRACSPSEPGEPTADTDEEAEFLSSSMMQSFVALRTGNPGKMPPPVSAAKILKPHITYGSASCSDGLKSLR